MPSTQTVYITVNRESASSQAALPPFTAIGAITIVAIASAVFTCQKKQ